MTQAEQQVALPITPAAGPAEEASAGGSASSGGERSSAGSNYGDWRGAPGAGASAGAGNGAADAYLPYGPAAPSDAASEHTDGMPGGQGGYGTHSAGAGRKNAAEAAPRASGEPDERPLPDRSEGTLGTPVADNTGARHPESRHGGG